MNRNERRALAHKERKLSSKLARAAEASHPPVAAVASAASALNIPEPGGVFPPLSAIAPTVAMSEMEAQRAPTRAATGEKTLHSTSADRLTPEPRPVSDAQLAANRANSLKSSGPTTEAGLAISSQNRTTHGLARHNGAFLLLTTEDPADFAALKTALEAEHQPMTETESILVNNMAESHWLSKRAGKLIETTIDPDSGAVADPKMFNLYVRYQATHTRAFHKSLNDLLKLRKETRTELNGFEAQKRAEALLSLKLEKHEMKKQGHYWDMLLKDGKAMHQLTLNLKAHSAAARENPGFEAQFKGELAKLGLKEDRGPVNVARAAF
jgi:hypothetical protein